jgi:hypothetical protein
VKHAVDTIFAGFSPAGRKTGNKEWKSTLLPQAKGYVLWAALVLH